MSGPRRKARVHHAVVGGHQDKTDAGTNQQRYLLTAVFVGETGPNQARFAHFFYVLLYFGMNRHLTVFQFGLVFVGFLQVGVHERVGDVRHRIKHHVEGFLVVTAEILVLSKLLGLEHFVKQELQVASAKIGCHWELFCF